MFELRAQRGRPAIVPFIMAGDPDLATTASLLVALSRAGAAAIELGIPFSDPLADGPTIAAASMRALEAGTRIDDVLGVAGEAREAGCAPIVLFGYYNPVDRYGIARFAVAAERAGVAGTIVPDVPLEEIGPLRDALLARAIAVPLLVAPSTPPDRMARIADLASGFVYVVSRAGTTGTHESFDPSRLRDRIELLRRVTDKPLAAGFGVSAAHHVQAVSSFVDGIIVGSALIEACRGLRGESAAARAIEFLEGLTGACPTKR